MQQVDDFQESPVVHSIVEGKAPEPENLQPGALAVNLTDKVLYSKDYLGNVFEVGQQAGNVVVASAATVDLLLVRERYVDVSGAAAISALTMRTGQEVTLRFTGALTLTHGASLFLLGGEDITTAAGDMATFRCYLGGVVRCSSYGFASGGKVAGPLAVSGPITAGRTGSAGEVRLARAADGLIGGTDKMVGDARVIDNNHGDIAIQWGGGAERIRTTEDGTEIRGGPLRVGSIGQAGLILLVRASDGAAVGEIYEYANELYIDCPLDDVVIARGLVEKLRIGNDGITTPGHVRGATIRPSSAGGYESSDSSAGITTTITTDTLVGKTMTIKDGLVTGFA